MFLICTFAGIAIGPIVGFITGCNADFKSPEQNKLLSGVVGWTVAAVIGVIVGAIIACNIQDPNGESFSLLGVSVHGAIWTAWISSICGAVVGVYTAGVMKKNSN